MREIFATHLAFDGAFAVTLLAVFIGGFVRGFTGFGSALVIIPALALTYGPREAVAMHAIMEIPVILGLLPAAVRGAERRTVLPMLVALAVTTPLGALALKTLNVDILKLLIAVMVLLMVLLLTFQKTISVFLGRRGAIAAGAAGGLIQGATGVGGPPVVTALLARNDGAGAARANIIAVMSSLIVLSIASFWLYGLISERVLVIGAVAAPVCLAATLAGSRGFAHWGDRSHRGAALGVLAIAALVMLLATLGRLHQVP